MFMFKFMHKSVSELKLATATSTGGQYSRTLHQRLSFYFWVPTRSHRSQELQYGKIITVAVNSIYYVESEGVCRILTETSIT